MISILACAQVAGNGSCDGLIGIKFCEPIVGVRAKKPRHADAEVLGEVLVGWDCIVLAKINDNRMTYELGVSPLRSKAIPSRPFPM